VLSRPNRLHDAIEIFLAPPAFSGYLWFHSSPLAESSPLIGFRI